MFQLLHTNGVFRCVLVIGSSKNAIRLSVFIGTSKCNIKTAKYSGQRRLRGTTGQGVKQHKKKENKESNKIVFKQIFTSDFIRRANESLQAAIDHKRIWFASKTTANGNAFTNQSKHKINLDLVKEIHAGDFIDTQDSLVYQTKKQCALIEVKSTARGTQTFDLPLNLKRQTGPDKTRKDSYSALVLGNWMIKTYYDMVDAKENPVESTFVPRFIA